MQHDPRILLWDVERAGADIDRFTAGMERDDWLRDRRTQAAVERMFEIIGEALNRLSNSNPEHAARIPDLPKIIGFRNILAHGYDIVAPEDVWFYARNDLPLLRAVVQALLRELGPPEP